MGSNRRQKKGFSMSNQSRVEKILLAGLILVGAAGLVVSYQYHSLKQEYATAVENNKALEEELDQRFDELLACEARLPVTEAIVDPE